MAQAVGMHLRESLISLIDAMRGRAERSETYRWQRVSWGVRDHREIGISDGLAAINVRRHSEKN